MKQLIEQQREDFEKRFKIFEQVAHDEVDGTFAIEHDKEKVWNWHKQSFKQFIDGLIAREEKEIENTETGITKDTEGHGVIGYLQGKIETVAHLKNIKSELI